MIQGCRYVPDNRHFVDMFPHTDGILDMFPHTGDIHTAVSGHVECIVLLSKLKSDKHIDVELEMDELDITIAESKATYEKIKDYVLKQSGLKVSDADYGNMDF